MVIEMPEKVEYIISTLLEHGYEAYAVGGCVRDALLGREPGDWDITTSAKPEQVKELFHRTIDTGIQHGTVTIMMGKEGFEVTTYRIDGEYEDSRHPKSVEFTTNLVEDLKRRDFTINAMAYNSVTGLVDEFDGIGDLKRKKIVCVGDPSERFEEDALRMLRAIRFSGQLDFEIEENTKQAIIKLSETITNISQERIRVELDKLLSSMHSDKLIIAHETGLTKYILPEWDRMLETNQNNPHHLYNVGEHCLNSVMHFNQDIKYSEEFKKQEFSKKMESVFCWALLLHDVGKPEAKTVDENGVDHFYKHDIVGDKLARKILRRLKFDNHQIDMCTLLIRWHDYRYELNAKSMRRAVNKIGMDNMIPLLFVQYADILAQSDYQFEEKRDRLIKAGEFVQEMKDKQHCTCIKDLSVNGRDLIEIGLKPGPGLGCTLEKLLEIVLETPEYNTKEILLDKVKSLK